MGGRGSKPVRTIKPEPEADLAGNQQPEELHDEVQTAEDTLGIVTAEQDYPEVTPPTKDLPTIPEEEDGAELISVVDDCQTKSANSAKPETGVIIPVQIGARLQKTLSKPAGNDAFHSGTMERRMNDAESSMTEALMTLSMTSRQNSTLAEQSLSLINTTLEKKRNQAMLTQREALLLERESYEYRKLTAPSSYLNLSTPRGQVRRHVSFQGEKRTVKRDLSDVTANEVAEMHKHHTAKTFKSLTDDLTAGFRSDAVKVKAILAWICRQSIGRIVFGQTKFGPDTPNGYMQLMQEGKGTYPGLFALLCRAAGIKCAIISGVSKGAGYEVGSTDMDNLHNAWNAVFVEDGWRLVHPLWVCKSLAGRRSSGWVTIETQGSSRHDVSKGNNGVVSYSYNDYFIFTKPEEFIYRHYPDDPKWQLLPEPVSCDDFLLKSYFRPSFFLNEFSLLTDDKCVLESANGEPVTICIGFRESVGPDLVFGYELSLKLDDSQEGENDGRGQAKHSDEGFGRFVLVSKGKDTVSFEIRFCKIGVYKLRLFGGLYAEYMDNPPWIMEVKLVCNGVTHELTPLPFDPGIVGWGPSPIAESLGLFVPSHESGVLNVSFEDVTVVHFILTQKMEFDISLRHFRIRPGVLEDHIKYEILDKLDILELRISLTCPKTGEYALKIDVSNGYQSENACNYLLKTDKVKRHETYHQRKSRKLLNEAMMTSDTAIIAHALKACEETAVPFDDPEVVAGERRLEFLHCKEELKTALLVNRIEKSESALYRVQAANLNRLFEREIKKVKRHLKHLLALDREGWNSRIPDINRISLMELGQLRMPKQPVRYVVMTMYMLLGVTQESMSDWSQIKLLLRNKDSTLIEMARLENYLDMDSVQITSLDESVLEQVEDVLQTYSEEDIRKIDNTAAAYYIWVKMVHTKLKQKIKLRSPTRSQSMKDLGSENKGLSKSVTTTRRHDSINNPTNSTIPGPQGGRLNTKPGTSAIRNISNGNSNQITSAGMKSARRLKEPSSIDSSGGNTGIKGRSSGDDSPLHPTNTQAKLNGTSGQPSTPVKHDVANSETNTGQNNGRGTGLFARSRTTSLVSDRKRSIGQPVHEDAKLNEIPGSTMSGSGSDVRNWTKSYRHNESNSSGNKASLSRRTSQVSEDVTTRKVAQSRQGGRTSVLSRGSDSKQTMADNRTTTETPLTGQHSTKVSAEKNQPTPRILTDKSLTQFSMPGNTKGDFSNEPNLPKTPSVKDGTGHKPGLSSAIRHKPDTLSANHSGRVSSDRVGLSPKQTSKSGPVKPSTIMNKRPGSRVDLTNPTVTSSGNETATHGRLKTAVRRQGAVRGQSQTSHTNGKLDPESKLNQAKQTNGTPRKHSDVSTKETKDQTFIKNKQLVPNK